MAEAIPLEKTELPENCFVFKHSTICPISTAAAEEVRAATLSLPLYWINVREQRDLSNWVAEEYGLRHESPQLLRIANGSLASHWNHSRIKRANFE